MYSFGFWIILNSFLLRCMHSNNFRFVKKRCYRNILKKFLFSMNDIFVLWTVHCKYYRVKFKHNFSVIQAIFLMKMKKIVVIIFRLSLKIFPVTVILYNYFYSQRYFDLFPKHILSNKYRQYILQIKHAYFNRLNF